MNYCKNCGLEVLQLCFCAKNTYIKKFDNILKSKSLVTAIDFYIDNYKSVLSTIKNTNDKHNLCKAPTNFFLVDIYKKWIK